MLWRFAAVLVFASMVSGVFAQGSTSVEVPRQSGSSSFHVEAMTERDKKVGSILDWKWKTEKVEGLVWRPVLSCVNKCNGKKHSKHESCDLSCDVKCTTTPAYQFQKAHSTELSTLLEDSNPEFNGAPKKSNVSTLVNAFSDFQLPGSARADLYAQDLFLKQLERADAGKSLPEKVPFQRDHFNDTPCSSRSVEVAYQTYKVTVDYSLSDTQKVDGAYKTTTGPKGQLFYTLLVPDKDQSRTTEPEISCKCEVKTSYTVPIKKLGETAYMTDGPTIRPFTKSELRGLITGVVANDMNTADISYMPMPMGGFYIPAGWELDSDDDDYQDLQIVEDFLDFLAGDEEASLGGPSILIGTKKVRVMCLNISKHEPNPDKHYHLSPPGDPRLSKLTAITKAERVRGPWDQMRLWIAANQASYEQIGKVLQPLPGPGTYVREFYRGASVGAFSPSDGRYLAIMDPRLLLAKNYDLAAVRWFLATKLSYDLDATLKWFDRSGGEIAAIFDRGTPKEDEILVGALAAELGIHGGSKGVAAAIRLLSETVPSEHRSAVMESVAVQEFALKTLAADDSESASLVLDWLMAAKPSYAKLAASNVNSDLSEGVRAKAEKLLDFKP